MLHLLGSAFPLLYLVLAIDKFYPVIILSAVTLYFAAFDAMRFFGQSPKDPLSKFTLNLLKDKERKNFNGATCYFCSMALAITAFPREIAAACLIFMTVGDTAAGIAGKWLGRVRFMGKTAEGACACFASCFIAGLFILPPMASFAGAATATAAEVLLAPLIDDNITMPLLSGAVLFLLLG